MRNRLIYICSPLRGDIEKNIQKAQGYCREAVDLWPDVIPIAPHVYCTQFLDDTIPQEREENRQEGKELGDALLVLPTHTGVINGVAAFESTTVRISGEVIVELAAELRRNRGHDITVEAEA